MLALDALFDTFDLRLHSIEYDHRRRTMKANVTFTIPIAKFDEDLHEGIARRFDEHVDADWRIFSLDMDDGPEVAWFVFTITACSDEACRHLQARIASAPLWFEETSLA